jgi:hypothetical protein
MKKKLTKINDKWKGDYERSSTSNKNATWTILISILLLFLSSYKKK